MSAADLLADYRDFLERGTVPKNKLHAAVVEELLTEKITLQDLKDSQDRRARQIEAKAGRGLECECGLLCFDLSELEKHIGNLSNRKGHGLRGSG